MRRIVSVWLPDWPITVWSRTAGRSPPPEGGPFALIERGVRGLTIHALTPAARAVGLFPGQAHADAVAAVPHLMSAPAELERDRKMLKRLALWAERFSPTVSIDAVTAGFEGLMLDMTGGAHLFGGEAALLAELRGRLGTAGVPARLAMADTPGAAWALARFSGEREVVAPVGGARAALADLRPEALRLSPEAVKLLNRLGLRAIGDLYALPRAGLARRFRDESGLAVVQRLDQALGAAFEPLTGERAAPRYRAFKVFAEPLTEAEAVAHWLPELAATLAAQMEADAVGARRLRLCAYRMDGGAPMIEARLSAVSARPSHLIRLLRERGLERLDLGFGADALMLSAERTEPLALRQTDMEAEATADDALAGLIDRLAARLGDRAVRQPAFRESWLPERSAGWVPANGVFAPPPQRAAPPRPLLTFEPPEPIEAIAELPDGAPARFTWRRVSRRVVKASGPERIAPEWWRDEAARTRDYYRAEDEAGRRYWLFREGLYGPESVGKPPAWRLHGLFE